MDLTDEIRKKAETLAGRELREQEAALLGEMCAAAAQELEQRLRSALPGEQWEQVWRHTLLTAQLRDMAYADYFAEGFRLAQELYRHPGA